MVWIDIIFLQTRENKKLKDCLWRYFVVAFENVIFDLNLLSVKGKNVSWHERPLTKRLSGNIVDLSRETHHCLQDRNRDVKNELEIANILCQI